VVYAYLQQHSHRFISNEFAGALAHRVSEVALGVNQTLSILLFDLIPLLVTLTLATVLLWTASPLMAAVHGRLVGGVHRVSVICWPGAAIRWPSSIQRRAAPARGRWWMRCLTWPTSACSPATHSSIPTWAHSSTRKSPLPIARWVTWRKIRWFQTGCGVVLKLGLLLLALQLWRTQQDRHRRLCDVHQSVAVDHQRRRQSVAALS
jgi:ATP-binding cassette subfamily B protein